MGADIAVRTVYHPTVWPLRVTVLDDKVGFEAFMMHPIRPPSLLFLPFLVPLSVLTAHY